MTATLAAAAPVTVKPACPNCGARLPLVRHVLAGRLRCPAFSCGAPVKLRAGLAVPA